MRKLGLLFLLLLLARASPAQVPAVSGSITTSSSNCSASAACVRLDLEDDAGAVSVTVSGTYSATLQFEGTGDGTNWVSVDATPFPSGTDVNSTTSTGTWRVNGAGLQAVRVRASAYTSGTASVTIRQGSVAVGSTGGGTGDIEGVTAGVGIGGGGTSGTVSITWAPEEQVDSVTLFDGANASRTFTFVLSGATDPTLTLANNSLSINVPVTADLVGDVTGNADTATTATTANAGDSATAFFSSGTLESTLLASDVVQEDIANTYTANLQDFALSTVKVPQASSCPVTLGLFCQDSDDQKVYIGDAVEADELQKTEDTYSTVTADTFPCGTVASFATCTAAAGIAIDADVPSIATASGEADFIASGALTCGASTQGKAQVHTTPLQYCDNAATPALQYTAYGSATGEASLGVAEAYDATGWDSDTGTPTKNDVRDKIETLGTGGTKTYAVWTSLSNQPPAASFATIDTRNAIPVLDFDAAADECAIFGGVLPEGYNAENLQVIIHWTATSATSGDSFWYSAWERMNTDLDADSFATAQTASGTANGTSGIITATTIAFTSAQIDGVVANEAFRLRVCRDGDGTLGTDDMTGDAELHRVHLRKE